MHRQGNCAGLNLQYKVYRTFQITLQNVCYPERFNCNSQEKKLYTYWLAHTRILMSLDPKEVFEEDWVDTYKKRISALHLQMSEIRSTFFLYEKIVKFPFHLFLQYSGHFWSLTRRSMFVAITVGLWRLLYDEEPNSLTVVKMRNEVMKRARDQTAKDEIQRILRRANLKNRLVTIKDEIRRMRHKHFAHLDRVNVDNPPVQASQGVTIQEISDLLDAAEYILNAIGLDTQYKFLLGGYDSTVRQPQGIDPRTDIEQMLDDMVKSSPGFNLPETNPYEFEFYWKNKNPNERKVFNQYRKKFGMKEIDNNR